MMPHTTLPVYLVSACLVGLCTRYDGQTKESPECLGRLRNAIWIPVCPEQLGGLPTPREAADITGGNGSAVLAGRARVLTKSGIDLTEEFVRGAEQVLRIARSQKVDGVFLKARSPSCAVNGTIGVTAALLNAAGFQLTEF
jgi:uncharacterized protein YbbK (DUF523 family)